MALAPSFNSLSANVMASAGFQESHLWNFLFLPSGGSAVGSGLMDWVSSYYLATVTQSVSLNFPQIETASTNTDFNYIESYKSMSDITITFLENKLWGVTRFLDDWFKRIWDPDKKVFRYTENPSSLYADALLAYEFYPLTMITDWVGQDKNRTEWETVQKIARSVPVPNMMILLKNLMFKGFSGIEANYTSADVMKITGVFACDSIEFLPFAANVKKAMNKGNA